MGIEDDLSEARRNIERLEATLAAVLAHAVTEEVLKKVLQDGVVGAETLGEIVNLRTGDSLFYWWGNWYRMEGGTRVRATDGPGIDLLHRLYPKPEEG